MSSSLIALVERDSVIGEITCPSDDTPICRCNGVDGIGKRLVSMVLGA